MPGKGRHVLAHRLIMELHLGRPLTPDEVVHHINGDPFDNRIENLQLMTNGQHSAHHHEKKFAKCRVCGTTENGETADLCGACYQRLKHRRKKGYDAEAPSRADMKAFWGKRFIEGRWIAIDSCISCGTTARPHLALGMCNACYRRKQRGYGPDCERCGAVIETGKYARYCPECRKQISIECLPNERQ